MSQSWRRLCGSSPVVGSSRKRILGLPTSAVATASRWRWPPESLPTQASAFSVSCICSSTSTGARGWRIKSGKELDGFKNGQLFRQPGFLQRDAHHLAQLASVFLPGLAQDRDLPRGRRQQAFQNFNGRGLPRAIRSQQAEALPGLDFKIQPANGFHLAIVSLAQVAALNRDGHGAILTEPCLWMSAQFVIAPIHKGRRHPELAKDLACSGYVRRPGNVPPRARSFGTEVPQDDASVPGILNEGVPSGPQSRIPQLVFD